MEDETALGLELDERDGREDIHLHLHSQVNQLQEKLDIWEAGSNLKAEMDSIAALTDPSKPSFNNEVHEFKTELSKLNRLSSSYMEDEEIGQLMKCLREALTNFRLELEKVPASSKDSDPIDHSKSSSRPTLARAAPITVDLPKFSGDPLQWRKFQAIVLCRHPHPSCWFQ